MNVRRISAAGVAVLAAGGMTGATLGTGENLGWVPQTVTVDEGDGHAVLTVQRDMCQTGRVRADWFSYREEDDTASGGADFEEKTGSFIFAECETAGQEQDEAVVTVPIADDQEEELDETFSVDLQVRQVSTNDTNPLPQGGARQGKVVIRDDDGGVSIATADVTVKEADGAARLAFDLDGLGEPTSVDVETFDGTAKAGDDYEARDDSMRVGADGKGTVDIPLTVDAEPEDDETFRVMFEWGEEQVYAQVTITDPEQPTETTPTTPTTTTPPPTETTPPTVTTPAPAPSPAPLPQLQRSTSQAPIRCASRRRFSISLAKYRSATVRIGGKPVKTVRRAGRLVAQVDLRGMPKGRFDVTVSGTAAKGGAKRSEVRRYRTCTPRKRTGNR